MNYMKHFLVLFFDEPANQYLDRICSSLFASYCPQCDYKPHEHHLTIQYFQCDESHYPKMIHEVNKLLPIFLPIQIEITAVHEYVNELNNFCCLSLLTEKSPRLMELHNRITAPIDDLHLHHEPSEIWPPHITCFQGLELDRRPGNWQPDLVKHLFEEKPPELNGIELRFTRWTGTHIETIHRF
ncbi:MAG: 2'-5' RNA ligase family protein [Candidatus Rifleibacteriota bacterium]